MLCQKYASFAYKERSVHVMIWTSKQRRSTVTQHDIRLAMLLERRFWARRAGQNISHFQDGDSFQTKRARFQPSTLLEFQEGSKQHYRTPEQPTQVNSPSVQVGSQAPEQSSKASMSIKCPSCGGQHGIANCPVRDNFSPLTRCLYCRGHHQTTDCPERKLERKTKQDCLACRGPHAIDECPVRMRYQPLKPCELCNGTHWLADCPQLKCALCGGCHLSKRCPTLTTTPQAEGNHKTNPAKPGSPCGICRGNHWVTECPHRLEHSESIRPTT
jgi:hypothetical protein